MYATEGSIGWKKFGFRFPISNNELFQYLWDNEYMNVFLRNECLRPSCYDCPAKGGKSMSDITLGDFWGIQDVHPEIDDDKGLSLVLINSRKGEALIESLDCSSWDENYDKALKFNPAIERSVNIPSTRSLFMNGCAYCGFKNAWRMLRITDLLAQMKGKLYGIIKR